MTCDKTGPEVRSKPGTRSAAASMNEILQDRFGRSLPRLPARPPGTVQR